MNARSGNYALFKRLRYELISRLYHQPELLRRAASYLRRKPSLARIAGVVAGRDTVKAVFHRQWSFSTTQAPNMLAGQFVIGMDAGTRQKSDREFLRRVIGSPDSFGVESAKKARERIRELQDSKPDSFDLIHGYLTQVVWAALVDALGSPAAQQIAAEANGVAGPPDELFHELRHLGAQLIIGSTSPECVRARAEQAGASVNRRVAAAHGALRREWAAHHPPNDDVMHCNAVGLMWVAHPATVQAGALCVQELLTTRKELLERLVGRAAELKDSVWSDRGFRKTVKDEVLNLLARRPPFPILARSLPRNAWFSIGDGFPPGHAAAGSELILLVIGALNDPAAAGDEDDRYLMFGAGERACIAREHVVEILASALTGLLLLPELKWARRWGRRIEYDGPVISRMFLKFG